GRLVCRTTNEAHHTRRLFYQVPGVVVQHHLDQHVTGEELALAATLLAAAHHHHFFSGHQHVAEQVLHAGQRDALFQRLLHLALEAGVGVNHVPALVFATCRHARSLVLAASADNHRDNPAEKGIKPPQQERHNQHHQHDDQRGVRGFLARRPFHFANFGPCFLAEGYGRAALGLSGGDEAGNTCQRQQYDGAEEY